MRVNGSAQPGRPIPAGYTYFGQFFDHDLTRDRNTLKEAWSKNFEDIENYQSSHLDLDHLYGGGPNDHCSRPLYQDDGVSLQVGPPQGRLGKTFDLQVNEHNRVRAADPRSSENVIIRQIAAVFAKLHNLAVAQFRGQFANDPAGLFVAARQQTTAQFRWLVWFDYLRKVLDPQVYRAVFWEGQPPQFEWEHFTVPIEFATAAMRFGHSMVLESYQLQRGTDLPLEEVVGRAHMPGNLAGDLEIQWKIFFSTGEPGIPISANPIDTHIADPLFALDEHTKRLFSVPKPHLETKLLWLEADPPELPLRTLLRGAAYCLPSGQSAARALGEAGLTADELMLDQDRQPTVDGNVLRANGWLEETPLWYYLLKESEIRQKGNCLGRTGSKIIAETIREALRRDDPVCPYGPAAEPPRWQGLPGDEDQIFTLGRLFAIAPYLS